MASSPGASITVPAPASAPGAILREASGGGTAREEGSLKTDITVEGLSKACYVMSDAVWNVFKTGRSAAVAMCSVENGHNGGGGGGGGIRWLHWFHLAVIVSKVSTLQTERENQHVVDPGGRSSQSSSTIRI
jgi:hypothetical protein